MEAILVELNQQLKGHPKRVKWHAADHDLEVVVNGVMGRGKDGRVYVRSETGTGIPLDEISGLFNTCY